MIKRLKNLWELTSFVPSTEGDRTILVKDKDFDEKVEAEFFSEGSLEDFERQEEQDKGFINRVFGL